MTHTLPRHDWLLISALAACAPLLGVLIALQPLAAVGLAALVIVTALAFLAPVTHLAILLFLTTIVPYSVGNKYAVGAGAGSPGLLASDLFLLTGLVRTASMLPGARLGARRLVIVVLVVLLVMWTLIEAYVGLRAGRGVSQVGVELRVLLGFSTALIATSVLMERDARERMMRALVVLGLLLGAWGLVQWQLQLPFDGEFGVREGVSFAADGRGQVQGGLFAFPVAVIIAAAALMTGKVRAAGPRVGVVAVLFLNATSLLLTFERTFWVIAVLGVILVALRDSRVQRGRALLWSVVIVFVAFTAVSAVSPRTLQTARERLVSIGQYGNDSSLRYRRVESEHVAVEIARAPLAGSGLAASIWWGQPWNQVPPETRVYTHNGYLWLVWRLGLVGAAMVLALFLAAISWRGPSNDAALFATLRVGAQASLLSLLVASVTFPTFNGYGITAVIGVLFAMCALPRSALREP